VSAPTRRLGDRDIHPIGLGCMPMSLRPGGRERDVDRGIAAIHAALDAGVRLLDTADAYALDEAEFGHNERLVAQALRGHPARDEVLVATKGGHTRQGTEWDLDGRPEYLRRACEGSLRRLETDCIGVYQFHRPDPKVPFEESVGALAELQRAGKIRYAGISNVTAAQIEIAREIVPVAVVQNELSLSYPDPLHNGEVDTCERHGIAFLPWSPFGGMDAAGALADGRQPLAGAAAAHGVSVHRVLLAWMLSLSDAIIPIPGAGRPESAADSAAAAALRLDPAELAAIDALAGYSRA
jgi:aryl-alcohol dehydrogenase-like predicted oxidoreductase